MGTNKTMEMPGQCVNCILMDICLENGCLKEKPCLQRLETKPVDEDLMAEMRERMKL